MRKLSTIGTRLALGFLICFLGKSAHAQPTPQEAVQQLEAKQYDVAIASFTSLIQAGSDSLELLHFNRGLAYYYTQQYDSATKDMERYILLAQAPAAHTNDAYYISGLMAEERGYWDGANVLYEEIQKTDGDYKDVNKRIKRYHLSVWVSKYWYYMIAMALITFIVIALLSSVLSSKRS